MKIKNELNYDMDAFVSRFSNQKKEENFRIYQCRKMTKEEKQRLEDDIIKYDLPF